MDSLFKKKSSSRSSQGTDVGFSSQPYDRTSATSTPPTTGSNSRFVSFVGQPISAPNTNDKLTNEGQPLNKDAHRARIAANEQAMANDAMRAARGSTTSLEAEPERLARTTSVTSNVSAPSIRRVAVGQRMDTLSEFGGRQQHLGLPATPASTISSPSHRPNARRDSEQGSIRSVASGSSRHLPPTGLGDSAPYPPHPRGPSQSHTVTSRGSRSSSNAVASPAPGQPLSRVDSHYAPSTYSTDSIPASANGTDGVVNFTPPIDEEDLNRRLREAYRKLNGVESGKLRVGHDKEAEMLARPFDVKLKILQQVEQLCSKLETESGVGKHPPEWYLQAIANGYATVKDILDLKVQLRTGQIPWFRSFCEDHHGVVVISKTLAGFQDGRTTTKTGDRSQDMQKENELIKTIRVIANNSVGLRAINDSRNVLPSIIALLTSPIVQNRQVANEILMALIEYSRTSGLKSVQEAFAIRSARLREVDSQIRRYTPWLTALEKTLDGRGRMGSLVGASPDMKRAMMGQDLTENTFNDYCFFSMCLINHLVRGAPPKSDSEQLDHGFEVRVGVRMELEASGVEAVINKLSLLNIQSVNGELQTYREIQEEDNRLATREYDRAILRSLKNPQDVFNGIMKNVSGTRTQETFLGIMRYLMLIKDDGDRRERHFELVQMLVRAAVMDGKDGVDRDFNSVVSRTVQQCLSKLDESHLLEQAREDNKDLKSRIIKLQRDKETMAAELAERDGGLVGHLKSQLAQTEEKLRVSRGLAETSKGDMDEIRLRYQEEIELLDNDLHELYTMLLETGMLEEVVGDDDYRRDLVARLDAQFERRKTIKILEGRHKKGAGVKKVVNGESHFSEDDTDEAGEEDVENGKVLIADKISLSADKGKEKALGTKRQEKVVSGSQFMDAEDERVRAHIESRLASEEEISPSRSKGGLPRSARTRDIAGGSKSPLLTTSRPPTIGQKSPGRYANIARAPGLSRVVAELKGRHGTIMRSSSAPADMVAERDSNSTMSEFRESAFSTLTDQTAATSVGSIANHDMAITRRHGAEGVATSPKDQIARRAQAQGSDSHEAPAPQIPAAGDEEDYPPPPPPPPMPPWLMAGDSGSSGDVPPPPPPPPPPMPGRPGMVSPFGPGGAGLLAGIAAGVKLRKAGDGAASTPSDKAISRPARRVSKRYEAPAISHASDRKAVEMTASKRMKQLQWEKLNKMHTDNTIWDKNDTPEVEMVAELQKKNIFSDMEDEFKAREIAYDAMAKKKKEELKSVLEPSVRKRVEILMARTKRLELEPEQMCDRIVAFDPELCDSTFLFELQPVLPTPEQISLLKQQNAETPDELLLIHPADRLMIRLIKIPHLADRLKGMQYKVNFEETITLLEKAVNLLQEACDDLQSAKQFKALLNVILMMGNYINGSNYAGGAWGFKMSSINRLVDTKSTNGQNLLHFLEKTISQHFPHIEGFLDELGRPAEAYRVSYEELSSGTRELSTGLSRIRNELETNFVNLNDGYARRMFPFVADAEERVLTLRDRVLAAGKSFNAVKAYYGEGDDRFDPASSAEFFGRPTSLEFFGTFKTFITSYQLCRAQNKVRDDAKASLEKRRLIEENRKKPSGFLSPQTTGASDKVGIMDDLTARLRKQGTPRANRTDRRRYDAASSPIDESFDWSAFGVDGDTTGTRIAEAARRMLSGLDDTMTANTPGPPESPTKEQGAATELTLGRLTLTLPEGDPFLSTFDLVDGADPSPKSEASDSMVQESKSPSSAKFSSPTKSRFAAATPELPALAEE